MHLIFNSLVVLAFGGLVFLVFAVEAVLLGLLAARLARRRPLAPLLRRPLPLAVHLLALVGTGCVLYGWQVEPYRLVVETHDVATPKLRRARLRLVHFSDTHCDRKARLEGRLAAAVNALAPDVIVFTGDALNSREALPRFRRTLAAMRARLGKFAVAGNFDLSLWHRTNLYAGTGFVLLERTHHTLTVAGERIVLHGLGFDQGRQLDPMIVESDPEPYNILLTHTPNLVEEVPTGTMDLYLCGHTHGGQVALPLYGALITLSRHGKRYEAGPYDVAGMRVYVNRGIGMEGGMAPRVRFLAPPEVTLHRIEPAGASH